MKKTLSIAKGAVGTRDLTSAIKLLRMYPGVFHVQMRRPPPSAYEAILYLEPVGSTIAQQSRKVPALDDYLKVLGIWNARPRPEVFAHAVSNYNGLRYSFTSIPSFRLTQALQKFEKHEAQYSLGGKGYHLSFQIRIHVRDSSWTIY